MLPPERSGGHKSYIRYVDVFKEFNSKNIRFCFRLSLGGFVMIKKIFTFASALYFVFSLCFVTAFAEPANNNETDNKTESYSTNYSNYLSQNASYSNSTESIHVKFDRTINSASAVASFNVPTSAVFNVLLSYKTIDTIVGDYDVSILIDGKTPFSEFGTLKFPRIWSDSQDTKTDSFGNDIPKEQSPYKELFDYYAIDSTGWSCDPYSVFLAAGTHSVTISLKKDEFYLSEIVFSAPEQVDEYQKPESAEKNYSGSDIIIEGENAEAKTGYWLTAKSDDTSPKVSPSDPHISKLNYIGGNWKTPGETLVWTTPHLKEGYYQLGFSFRQDTLIGSSSYRWLKIDGKTPFLEAKSLPFQYKSGWQMKTLADKVKSPYVFYLSEGVHKISLTVTLGDMQNVSVLLKDAMSIIGDLYIDMTMITGETVDVYRDYDLFTQISDMEDRLNKSLELLKEASQEIKQLSDESTGTYTSVVDNMIRVVEKMLNNKYAAHRYKSTYYSNYCSLSSTLNDMSNMPLDIDRIILSAPGTQGTEKIGFFNQLLFSVQRFFTSFLTDYNSIDISDATDKSIEIWGNWGRDQAQVLNTLTKKFTDKSGIGVNVKITNATVIQAVLSGVGPNVILNASRTEPVNLAMRNVIVDLYGFDDCTDVLKRFQSGAETPYLYKNGLYALPDTQTFYMMYYRKDILDALNLSVPLTWDDFKQTAKVLARNNLDVWLPCTQITDMSVVNAGVGSLSIFPTLMLQSGLSFYRDDGKSTTLSENDTIRVFENWTDFYTKYKLPASLSFYNRFRTGVCPLGIDSYLTYNTISAAAVEIEGKWGFASVPGTLRSDGTVDRTSAGGGSGCCIMKSTPDKEQMSWEFLKWWTSADTQLSYSNNIEAVLGPTGRIAVSNTEAMLNLSWSTEARNAIADAWKNVKEIQEVPGSYYLARGIDSSFWSVVNNGSNPKDMLYKWSSEVDDEIARKWNQYENR